MSSALAAPPMRQTSILTQGDCVEMQKLVETYRAMKLSNLGAPTTGVKMSVEVQKNIFVTQSPILHSTPLGDPFNYLSFITGCTMT